MADSASSFTHSFTFSPTYSMGCIFDPLFLSFICSVILSHNNNNNNNSNNNNNNHNHNHIKVIIIIMMMMMITIITKVILLLFFIVNRTIT